MNTRPPKPDDRPSNPRTRKHPSQKSNGRTIVQQQISDAGRISHDIPDNVKIAFADAIMTFSDMEMGADHFIWDVLGLSLDDGKLAIQIDTADKFELAKKLSVRYQIPIHVNVQSATEAWTLIKKLIEARNKMAHGVWKMIDDKTPIAVSYRIPTDPGTINSEHFPIERMNEIAKSCRKIKPLLERMAIAAKSLHQIPEAQHPLPTPNLPEHPLPNSQ